MNFHDIDQNTEEWMQLRAGKLTGSSFGKIMSNFGKAFGEPAKKLAMNIATEQITGKAISSGYTNEHMERGHEQEPVARMLYEETTFSDVLNGGFYDCGHIGCSPDGRVDEGLIEIKSVIPNVHLDVIKKQSYSNAYKWQLIGNMYHTGAEFIDFVSYCADFPEGKRLYICKLTRDKFKAEFDMLVSRESKFLALVGQYKDVITNSNYEVTI